MHDASSETMPSRASRIGALAMRLESLTLQAAFAIDSDPSLGATWRRMAAIREACASSALEIGHVREADVALAFERTHDPDQDPQAFRRAQEIHRALLCPGDLIEDGQHVLERLWRATRLADVEVDGEDFHPIPPSGTQRTEDSDAASRFFARAADAISDIHRKNLPHILGSIAAGAIAGLAAPWRDPAFDRIVCMAYDSSVRLRLFKERREIRRWAGAEDEQDDAESMNPQVSAAWILTPSMALRRGARHVGSFCEFRSIPDLLSALASCTREEIGRMAEINGWRLRVRKFCARRRSSRSGKLEAFLLEHPLLDADSLARGIDVTGRMALNIIRELEAARAITLMTPRRSHRVWACAPMAKIILSDRDRHSHRSRQPKSDEGFAELSVAIPDAQNGTLLKAEHNSRFLAEMDRFSEQIGDAMSEIDAILWRIAMQRAANTP